MSRLRRAWCRLGPRWQTLLGACAVAASFPPWDLGPLVWVALVPWLAGLARLETRRQALLQGFWMSFGVGLLVAPWLAVAVREFLGVPWAVAVLAWVLFAASFAQPQFMAFAPLFHWLAERPPAAPSVLAALGLAACYTGLDWVMPRLFDVGLGYALHDAARLRQLADLGGVALLGFLIALVNLLVWQGLEVRARAGAGLAPLLGRCAWIALLFVGATGYGELRHREVRAIVGAAEEVVRADLVQGNVENRVRLAWAAGDDRAAERQLDSYMLPTEKLLERAPPPDLVVWPETAFPGVFRQPATKAQQGRANRFDRQVLRMGTPIVFGAYDMEERDGRRSVFNSIFAITPRYAERGRQGIVQVYRKHRLLPFAEAIPGVREGDWIRRLLPTVGFFARGPGARIFRIGLPGGRTVRINPIICSESLDAQHVVEGARLGSQLILNVGSDGWFGRYGEPQFHLAISRFRSIETRLPQLRAANTGISAVILPDGDIPVRSSLGEATTLHLDVPLATVPTTVMVRWGDWFGRAAFAAGAVFVLPLWVRRRSPA